MRAMIERIAIVGAGAMGGMYAAHLQRAGFDVVWVASGERAERLRRLPYTVNGEPLELAVLDAAAAESPTPADLVIFAVKDGQLAAAIADAEVAIGPNTIAMSILNGLDSEERIAERYGVDHVLLCTALGMDAERTGQDVRFRQSGRIVFAHLNGTTDHPDVQAVSQALDRAQLAWQTPSDMRRQLWWKFMVNVGINQASAVLRAPYGAFHTDGDARDLMLALINEVLAVAAAEQVNLDASDVERWNQVLAGQPAEGWTSMAQDVLAGRETEVESFAGRVVALGTRHGIATPYNQAVLWILRASVD